MVSLKRREKPANVYAVQESILPAASFESTETLKRFAPYQSLSRLRDMREEISSAGGKAVSVGEIDSSPFPAMLPDVPEVLRPRPRRSNQNLAPDRRIRILKWLISVVRVKGDLSMWPLAGGCTSSWRRREKTRRWSSDRCRAASEQ
jgi:hypothetical protein